MKKENTLIELLVGIFLLGIVIQLVCVVVSKNYLYDAIGLWSGILVGGISAIHMKRTIEDVLDLGEYHAKKYVRNAYLKRMLVALVVMGAVLYFQVGNPITLLVGIFPLKLAAYLQPYVHRLFLWIESHRSSE